MQQFVLRKQRPKIADYDDNVLVVLLLSVVGRQKIHFLRISQRLSFYQQQHHLLKIYMQIIEQMINANQEGRACNLMFWPFLVKNGKAEKVV